MVALQRDTDADWGPFRCNLLQDDMVKRQTQGVGLRTIDLDDAPLNRAIVAKAEHRSVQRMGAQARRDPARCKSRDRNCQRARQFDLRGKDQPGDKKHPSQGIACGPRLHPD